MMNSNNAFRNILTFGKYTFCREILKTDITLMPASRSLKLSIKLKAGSLQLAKEDIFHSKTPSKTRTAVSFY